METHATYDDVNLVLRLYELRREERMRKARAWFAANFRARTLEEVRAACPPGSDEDAYLRMIVSYWEMAASFIVTGVLNEDLFFRTGGEMLYVWERIRDLLPAVREAYRDPAIWRDLETVAGRFARWMNARTPGSYEAFSARVRGQ